MELAKAEFDYTVEKAEAEMLRLQKVEFEQKALRAQMNPHFIFNSLNAVRNYINSEETEIADKFLVDFSKLIRSILSNSNKPYLSLEKNIEFLTCYMDLEAKRFRQSFTFSIDVLDELETDLIQIPTLLIQPFVENAIIHGLQGNKGGHISIKFSELSEDVIRCTIEDNGKGRKARAAEQGKENKSHVSMATDITNQRLASFGLDKEQGLKVAISDPQDKDGNALGTIVSIDIPIQLSL